jgi:hypothetical protein
MELSYYETTESEINSLKEIINNMFSVDLSENTRERKLVDARKVYSKVLRDRGHTYELIAKSLNRDHATIIHYMSSIDSILLYDKNLRDKYLSCKSLFLEGKGELILNSRKKDVDLFMTIIRLNGELQDAIKEKKEILTKFVDYLEQFEKTTGYIPNVLDIKRNILPKFNS